MEKTCVLRSLKVALLVGTVLAILNHYDAILSHSAGPTTFLQILITYAVPYAVSIYGAAMQAVHMESHGLLKQKGSTESRQETQTDQTDEHPTEGWDPISVLVWA